MTTKYYLGFHSSTGLTDSADTILSNYANNASAPQEPHFETLVSYFIPELLDAFLINTCTAVGLGPMATKVVNGAADTISKTSTALVAHLLKKRSNEELRPMADFVDETYLRAETCSSGKNAVGCEVTKDLYDRMLHVIGEVKSGNAQSVLEELHGIMIEVVDVVLEGFMKRAIGLLKVNFVLRKICDAAIVTCRGAGHMVVNKVFKKLDDEQLDRLADYFENLMLTAER